MVNHDYLCAAGHYFEATVDVNQVGWDRQPCDQCDEVGEQVWLSRQQKALNRLPVVVYRTPDGGYRFPGSADPYCQSAKKYNKLGYQRVELPFSEARKFCREMNDKERAKMSRHLERTQRAQEEIVSRERAELRQAMQHMSPYGRDYAQLVIEMNNRKEAKAYYSSDPGFHIEGME